jgi:hypothetical protein
LISHPRQPLNFEAHTESATGHLAYESHDFDLAENALRRAVELRVLEVERIGPTVTLQYNVARDRQTLALVLARTGRTLEAIDELRRARQLPNRADAKRSFLTFQLAALRTILDNDPSPVAQTAAKAEIEAVNRELTVWSQVKPDRADRSVQDTL